MIAWNRLEDSFTSIRVADVMTNAVEMYIEKRRAEGIKPATINRETGLLIAIFNHGAKITTPMVDRVPSFPAKLKESEPRTGFITYAQYKIRALIACAYTFGFRKGELLNLRVRQIDYLDPWIELEEGTTKNGEARKVRMTAEMVERMRAATRGKNEDAFVFTREGGSRVVDPRDDWYNLCVASGVGKFVTGRRARGEEYRRYLGLNLHDIRRSAIRNMTRWGVGQVTAMRISGDKTASVFRRYNIIVDEADLVEASKRIEQGQEAVPEVKTGTKTYTSGYGHS